MNAETGQRRGGRALGAAAVATLLAAAAPAAAQLSPSGGPIAYSADNLEYADQSRTLVLIGAVEVAQGTATLRANKLTLFFNSAEAAASQALGSNDIDRIVAEGDVFYIRPEQTAHGDRAEYVTASDSVTFSGNVVVASDENVVRGETLVLELGSGRTTVKPGEGPGQRVRGVFRTRPAGQ